MTLVDFRVRLPEQLRPLEGERPPENTGQSQAARISSLSFAVNVPRAARSGTSGSGRSFQLWTAD